MTFFRIMLPNRQLSLRVFVLLALVGLSACGGSKKPKVEDVQERPVEELYNEGMDALHDKRYNDASKAFDEVERQHPYSVWARRAMLMGAYAHYEKNEYDEAILAAQRFIQLHPGNRDVAYAYYLVAICYYEQISDVERDQKDTQLALNALEEVVRRFPDTAYARDARLKEDLARDHLAGKEMEVGRNYEKAGMYLAAINRFRTVVDKYQTTTHVPEALHRLTECYLALGLTDQAQKTAAVLGYNYPGSDWYRDSYALLKGKGLPPRNDEKKSRAASAL